MSMSDPSPRFQFAVMTLFPEAFTALTDWGVTGRAFQTGLCTLHLQDPRDESTDLHGTVDDLPNGGGPGMVMQAPILSASLAKAKAAVGHDARVVALSPQGQKLDVHVARQFAEASNLILIAGRYEGLDERFVQREVDMELSVGDFVVSGGELPAMLLIDAIARWIPGVLGHEASAEEDSFLRGCSTAPITRAPRSMRVSECPRYCSVETTQPSPVGAARKQSGEPWIAGLTCWHGSDWTPLTANCS